MEALVGVQTQFVDHIAIAVPSGQLDSMIGIYERMGFRKVHEEHVLGTDQVREVLMQVGESQNLVQLLEPLTLESPVQKQLEKAGGRAVVAHVAFRVENAEQTYASMKADGFNLIDAAPRAGSRGTTVFFVHPKTHAEASLGVLFEMVEEPK